MNMKYVLSRFIHWLNQSEVLIQRHTVYSFDFPIISRIRRGFYSKAASIVIFDAFDAASNRGNTQYISHHAHKCPKNFAHYVRSANRKLSCKILWKSVRSLKKRTKIKIGKNFMVDAKKLRDTGVVFRKGASSLRGEYNITLFTGIYFCDWCLKKLIFSGIDTSRISLKFHVDFH